jgi:hypothetical protein
MAVTGAEAVASTEAAASTEVVASTEAASTALRSTVVASTGFIMDFITGFTGVHL